MCLFLFSLILFIQQGSTNTKSGLALQGYDPVSYFSNNPVKGSEEFEVKSSGIKYYFASDENKKIFLNNKEKYTPIYGGWCAYAMGVDGSKVKIDPLTYKIIDERLYLFYNFRETNTLTLWNENELNLKIEADNYWSKISKD